MTWLESNGRTSIIHRRLGGGKEVTKNMISINVKGTHHASEPLLTGSVPQLQADLEAIHVDLLRYEESAARRGGVLGVKLVLRISMEETSLSDTCYER